MLQAHQDQSQRCASKVALGIEYSPLPCRTGGRSQGMRLASFRASQASPSPLEGLAMPLFLYEQLRCVPSESQMMDFRPVRVESLCNGTVKNIKGRVCVFLLTCANQKALLRANIQHSLVPSNKHILSIFEEREIVVGLKRRHGRQHCFSRACVLVE